VVARCLFRFFFQAEDGIRDFHVTGVQTCALAALADALGRAAGAAARPAGAAGRVARALAAARRQLGADRADPAVSRLHRVDLVLRRALRPRLPAAARPAPAALLPGLAVDPG